MPRARQRACLEHGLKLDINRLARQGVLDPNGVAGPAPIEWTNTYTGEEVASGTITADMEEGPDEGWLRIRIGKLLSASTSTRCLDILEGGNGTSGVRPLKDAVLFYGCRPARGTFAAAKHGASRLLTPLSLHRPWIAPIAGGRKLNPG